MQSKQQFFLWRLLAAVAATLGLFLSGNLFGQQPAADGTRVARLIEQLSDADYQRRAAATKELTELGSATRAQLTAALSAKDPEIRLRAADLLSRLEVDELWGAPKFTISSDNANVADALEKLSELSGNHVMAGERYGSYDEAELKLDAGPATFWQTLDAICRQSGNHVRPHYNPRQPGLVVVSGKPGLHPVAHSGPLRAQIASARRVFNEDLDYETGKSEIMHTFQLNLQVIWEDRFHLVAYRSLPDVVTALTDTGVNLKAEEQEEAAWNVASPGIRQLSAGLRLTPPPRSAKSLQELKLEWELIAVGGMQTIELFNLEPESRQRSGDADVLLEKIEERPGGRYIFTVVVSRDLVTPAPQDALLYENELELLDENGRSFHHHGETNSLVDRGVRMVVTFQAPEGDAKPHSLKLHFPRIRSQRKATIVLKDVPLPVAGPN